MFLLILDKNPYRAAELVPDRLKFKSLIELSQILAGAGITKHMKPIKQGKKLQSWVKDNLYWTFGFYEKLFVWAFLNIKMEFTTKHKLTLIEHNLFEYFKENSKGQTQEPTTAIFRYVKEYAEFTEYESNSELPIDECVECYKKYINWKEKRYANRGTNKKRVV